jgi:hypothetical protein
MHQNTVQDFSLSQSHRIVAVLMGSWEPFRSIHALCPCADRLCFQLSLYTVPENSTSVVPAAVIHDERGGDKPQRGDLVLLSLQLCWNLWPKYTFSTNILGRLTWKNEEENAHYQVCPLPTAHMHTPSPSNPVSTHSFSKCPKESSRVLLIMEGVLVITEHCVTCKTPFIITSVLESASKVRLLGSYPFFTAYVQQFKSLLQNLFHCFIPISRGVLVRLLLQ